MTASGRKHYENWGKCILCFARSDKETSSPNLCKSVVCLKLFPKSSTAQKSANPAVRKAKLDLKHKLDIKSAKMEHI